MYLLVELYQLQLSFKLILCKWSTFLSGTVYSLHSTTRPGNCACYLHTHTHKTSVFPAVLRCWGGVTGTYST